MVNTVAKLATINNTPIAVIGDLVSHPYGPDMLIEGCPGILLNNRPISFVTGKTAKGAVVISGSGVMIETGETYRGQPGCPNLVEESKKSKVTLQSRFALEELFAAAKKDSEVIFITRMMEIFGADIPVKAFKKLYEEASEKKLKNPEIEVVRGTMHGHLAGYDTLRHVIVVTERAVMEAETDNELRAQLMVALVEEFGHHLDYLLRQVYSKAAELDAWADEGARYSYRVFFINPFEKADQHFADATIDGRNVPLKFEFAAFHEELTSYTESRQDNTEDSINGVEFFGAGDEHPERGQFGHGSIEKAAFAGQFPDKIIRKIYFGNWLRDFSQFIDPAVVRPMAQGITAVAKTAEDRFRNKGVGGVWQNSWDILKSNAIEAFTNKDAQNRPKVPPARVQVPMPNNMGINIKSLFNQSYHLESLNPTKFSRGAITSLVRILALQEFMGEKKKEGRHTKREKDQALEKPPENWIKLMAQFEKDFLRIDEDLVGLYRPEEHIDNPMALVPDLTKVKKAVFSLPLNWPNSTQSEPLPGPRVDKSIVPDPDPLHANFALNQNMLTAKEKEKAALNPKLVGFVDDPSPYQFEIDRLYVTKNYIRSERAHTGAEKDQDYAYTTSYDYVLSMLKKAAVPGGASKPECLVAFGAAMHVLEDYYAHSNVAEISLIKTYSPSVFPWVEIPNVLRLNKGTVERLKGWISEWKSSPYAAAFDNGRGVLTTHADTKTNPDLLKKDVNPGNNKDCYYMAAEYFPVVTGSFGFSDTVASVLPKMNNKLLSPIYQEPEHLREGERTMQDALILTLLKDFSKAQNTDYAKKNGALNGTSNTDYVKAYESYLTMRDLYVRKNKVYGVPVCSIDEFMRGFGIAEFIGIYKKMAINFLLHHMVGGLAAQILTVQTALQMQLNDIENGKYQLGSDPTHTQLAKDNPEHVLHNLAAEMAIHAVREIGIKMSSIWNGKDSYERLVSIVSDYMKHPVHTQRLDSLVIKWAQTHKSNVLQAAEASIVINKILDTIKELSEVAQSLRASRLVDKVMGSYAKDKNALLANIAQINKNNVVMRRRAEIINSNMEKEKESLNNVKEEGMPADKPVPKHKH